MRSSIKCMIILFVLCGGCISIPTQAKETVIIMNEYLSVEVSPLGAELQSLKSKQSGIEYLWQGNPEYWKRRSPILFPFIGRLWKNGYNYNNERYEIEMHGFAKDCIFDVVKKEETEIWFRLSDSEITLKKYPFKFELLIGLNGTTDGSKEIIESFEDSRIKIFEYDQPSKSKTLNKLIGEAKYDWISIQDDDDIWIDIKLESQINYTKEFDVIGTFINYINENGNIIGSPNLSMTNETINASINAENVPTNKY